MKRAVIVKFKDRYVIHSESTTVDGYGLATEHRAKGLALDYETASKFVYVYDLKPKTVKEVFHESHDKKLLGTYTNGYYLVYEVKSYKGVFMLADNGHFNSAFWYPDFETCKIINEFDYDQGANR